MHIIFKLLLAHPATIPCTVRRPRTPTVLASPVPTTPPRTLLLVPYIVSLTRSFSKPVITHICRSFSGSIHYSESNCCLSFDARNSISRAAYDQLVAGLAINRSSTTPGRCLLPLPPAPVLPPCPPFKVRFMTRQSFKDVYGRETTHIAKYFEGAKGERLSKERIDVICRIIHRFWRALAKKGLLPEKWGGIDGTAFEWLKAQVYTLCPELRFCSNDWKLHFYCQRHYSSWRTQNISKRSHLEIDNDDENGAAHVSPKPAKRRRPSMMPSLFVEDLVLTHF
jgi:hypothetical protein